uniref:3Beta_HSD domain-containing protein n=1 Tax=Syphacia muris TaxID=451379 RepID=A0A0N5ASD0_9BILA
MPSRICIIGGGGYLGQHIANGLQLHGSHTVLMDIRFINVPLVQLNEQLTTRITGNLLKTDLLRKALEGCESCYHLAAYGVRGGHSLDKAMTYRVNVDGIKAVVECCKQLGVQRLIFTSSVTVVFSDQQLLNSDETQPYLPESKHLSSYCATKALAEKYILKSNTDTFRTCALRLRGIYGPGEPNMVQQCIDICEKGGMLATFEKSKNCITQYSNIVNCVSAALLAEDALRHNRACGQVYNIVDDGNVGSLLFWKPLIEATGHKYPRICVPYLLIYYVAYLFEWLYCLFGIEPIFTRAEINLMAISNTYSIEKAKRDLGYSPVDNNDLTAVVEYYKTVQKQSRSIAQKRQRLLSDRSVGLLLLLLPLLCFFAYLLSIFIKYS